MRSAPRRRCPPSRNNSLACGASPILGGGSAESNAPRLAAFREGMAALRWTEGRNYVIDGSYANAAAQALDGLADELVASRPDVILTPADEVTMRVAKRG